MVKDKQNRKALENINVSVYDSNVDTVTSVEGEFALKVKRAEALRELEISHIGYINNHTSLERETPSKLTVRLTSHTNLLNEVVVFTENLRMIIEKAIGKTPLNYSDRRDMLTGFYRETVRKGRRYIGILEAVIDVSRTAYADKNINYDKVRVMKGRRLLSQKASDTLAVKVVGDPNLSIILDVVKNEGVLLDMEELNGYEFQMAESMLIDNRIRYVINFRPKVVPMHAFLYSKLYIGREHLSFARIEVSLDMQDKSKVITTILYKKSPDLRLKPQELSYLVTYKDMDGKTYLSYINNTIRFRCDWKKRLFSTNYTVASEMVATDKREGMLETIPNKEAFSLDQIFYDRVGKYWSPDFWRNYNIIEPTEFLEHAVDELKKQSN